MDWSNERWVKIYTRDTLEWLTWSWQAQALHVLMYRKADRSGVIEVGTHGAAGLCTLLRWPASELEPALSQLLRTGAVIHTDHAFILKNFIESQEARASDAQRQRESRERRREAIARGQVSHDVTRSHIVSHDVTPRRDENSEASLAKRSRAKSDTDVFHTSDVAAVLTNPPELHAALVRFLAHFYAKATPERVRLVLVQLQRTLTPEGCRIGKGCRAQATARSLTAALEATLGSTVRNPDRAIVIVLQKLFSGPVNLQLNQRQETDGEARAREVHEQHARDDAEFRQAVAAAEAFFATWPDERATIEASLREELDPPAGSPMAEEAFKITLGQRLLLAHRSHSQRGIA